MPERAFDLEARARRLPAATALVVAPQLLEAVDGDDPLGHLEALAAARAPVGALAADLHRRVARRALAHLARRQLRRVGRQPPGDS